MLISNYITPVMFTDSTGYALKWIEEKWESVKDWWNTNPRIEENESSNSGVLGFIGGWCNGISTALGSGGLLLKANKLGKVWGTFENGLSFGVKTIGNFISFSMLGFDIANIWDSRNGNTNGERLIKSVLTIQQFLFAATVSTAVTSMVVASAPILAIGVVVVTGVAISYGMYESSKYLYRVKGIE